ncbi:DUF1176 domain-containing protein [Sphingomonas sp. G-3-2-10]|uniref:DUF1176 domain-containing protein n=1 Tax=Sphingomonas sp. G-3-2-10 TaxID=2728838 RepID=UPI00146C79A1|nr:DUF1176 domain-containing protein [Sphingomonas sp. G-3-2-10]NML07101.1 DUF1176 domain-containing protein [Sphingomonas sp. G-3-2-10]
MPMLPFILAPLLLLQNSATPNEVKIFGDWAVGCDNIQRCEMTSLIPGDGTEPAAGYDEVSFSVERMPGPAGGFTVEVQMPDTEDGSEVSIRIDAAIIAGAVPKNGLIRFTGANAAKIVAAMANGKEMNVTDIADTLIGLVSLKGSSAALRFIDAGQGRAGTVTAVVAKGGKPATTVPMAAPAPQIRFVRPAGRPEPVPAALRKALDKQTECGAVYEGGTGPLPAVETFALGGGKTLVLLPCGSGAYNYSTIPFILSGGKAVIAPFDRKPEGMSSTEGSPELVNAAFDAKTGILSSYAKGRGVGDCGAGDDYVWDGTRFRLAGSRTMPDCRGSSNWLTVWRTNMVAQ